MALKPRIVITGAAGFVGSNLAERLVSEGFEVVGIDDLSAGDRGQIPAAVNFSETDVRSPALSDLLRRGDIIFHLAAKTSVPYCQSHPVESASVNVLGTVNVFEAAANADVRRVIYAETAAVYEGIESRPTPEDKVKPQSFYAIGKFATRAYAEAYGRFRGLPITALRYFNVYGPRQDYRRAAPPAICAFILNLLQQRRPTIYGSGDKRRDFIYVDDVNDFHLRCIADPRVEGRIFNLGSGRNYPIREVYNRIDAILNTGLEPIYGPNRPAEAIETLGDIAAARSLGWEPQVDLDEGLRRTVDYIRVSVLPALMSGAAPSSP